MTPLVFLVLKVSVITVFSFLVNLPFGYWRRNEKKFSVKWFLYIHLPIPLIIAFRVFWHAPYWGIPVFIAAAVLGQLIGARIGKPALQNQTS